MLAHILLIFFIFSCVILSNLQSYLALLDKPSFADETLVSISICWLFWLVSMANSPGCSVVCMMSNAWLGPMSKESSRYYPAHTSLSSLLHDSSGSGAGARVKPGDRGHLSEGTIAQWGGCCTLILSCSKLAAAIAIMGAGMGWGSEA